MAFNIPSIIGSISNDNDLSIFGDGSDGIFNSTDNTIFADVGFIDNVISRSYQSFTLNAGHTFQTNIRNRGLIIRVLGDAIINGTIANNDLASRFARNTANFNFIECGSVDVRMPTLPTFVFDRFLIPAGGAGGAGGGGGGAGGGVNCAFGGSGGGGGAGGGGINTSSSRARGGGGAGGGTISIFHRGLFVNNGSINVSGSLGGAFGASGAPAGSAGGGGGGAGNGGAGGAGAGGSSSGSTGNIGNIGAGNGGAGGDGAGGGSAGGAGGLGGGGLILLLVRGNLTINGSIQAMSTGNGGNGGLGHGLNSPSPAESGQIGTITIRRI